MTSGEKNQENDTIHNNLKNVLRVTLTKQVKDLHNIKLKTEIKISEDEKISSSHVSVGSILKQWPFYLMQFTDSMKSPSKFQYNYSQNLTRQFSNL